jgi:hypothetical protein
LTGAALLMETVCDACQEGSNAQPGFVSANRLLRQRGMAPRWMPISGR